MREIIPDRTKNCKNYNKILSKIASKQIDPLVAPVKTQMLIKMPVDFLII
jgi:hypothetical protein